MVETQLGTLQRVRVENLLIDLQNPRYDPRTSQREALKTIATDQGPKLVNLAEDILDKGLNLSDLPIVNHADNDSKIFIVLEGNRRVAALKLLSVPGLLESLELPPHLVKRYQDLKRKGTDSLPKEIYCTVLSREDANYWIRLKHTGGNEGVGVLDWDGLATHRFHGSSPALQAFKLVEKSTLIDDETKAKLPKIAITNIERILGTPDARMLLGVDVKGGHLTINPPEEQALARLAIIVTDIANRRIRVTDLDTKEQRVKYAKEVAERPLPTPRTAIGVRQPKPAKQARISADRPTLVPKQLTLTIAQTRINQIFSELQKLKIELFTNSCAVLFRVLVEMSVDDFAQRRSISLKDAKTNREKSLRQKLKAVADYLEKNGLCNKDELRGIRALTTNRDHVLSVDSWNAYVHNKEYNPTPKELKSNWDSVQAFIEAIWRV